MIRHHPIARLGAALLLLATAGPVLAQTGTLTYGPAAAAGGSTVQAVPIPPLLLLPLAIALALLGGRFLRREQGRKLLGALLLTSAAGLGTVASVQVPQALADLLMIALDQPEGGSVEVPLQAASFTNSSGVGLTVTGVTPPPACTTTSPADECVVGLALANGASCTTAYTCTLPEVTVTKTADGVEGETPTPGAFTLTRTGDTANPLTVTYALTGTASGIDSAPTADLTDDEDYQISSLTEATFPAGASTLELPITVLDDQVYDPSETATLSLSPNAAYTVGTDSSAELTITAQDKRIFVTASAYDGNLGGITGADTKCNVDSARPDPSVSYKAMLAGSGRQALPTPVDWVLQAGAAYFTSDSGNPFMARANGDGVFEFDLHAVFPIAGYPPTGLNPNWTNTSGTCGDWATTSFAEYATTGSPNAVTDQFINDGVLTCEDEVFQLYCAEQ